MSRIEIPGFESNIQGPVGTEKATGADFGNGAAWETLGQNMVTSGALLQRRNEQIEVSDLNANLSQLHADATNDWKDKLAKAKPGDQSFAESFMNDLDDKLADLGQNVSSRSGQQYFNTAAARMREHFSQLSNLGQANLASQHAVNNANSAHAATTAALLMDPTGFDTANSNEMSAIDAMAAAGSFGKGAKDIPEKLKAQYQKDNVVNSIRGEIQDDPNAALARIKNGDWNDVANGNTLHQMMGEANAGIRAERIDTSLARAAKKEADHDKWEKINQTNLDAFVNKTLDAKSVSAQDLPTEGPLGKNYWIGKLEAQTKAQGEMPRDHAIYTNILHQILLPQGEASRITSVNDIYMQIDHGINPTDATQLVNIFNGRKTAEGEDEAREMKTLLDGAKKFFGETEGPFAIFKDPYAGRAYAGFEAAFLREYRRKKDQGVYFRDLLEQNSDKYLGNMVGGFIRTPTQIKADEKALQLGKFTAAKSTRITRNPGETIDAFTIRKAQMTKIPGVP